MHTCCCMESRSIVMIKPAQSAPRTSHGARAATTVMIHTSLPTLPLMPGTDNRGAETPLAGWISVLIIQCPATAPVQGKHRIYTAHKVPCSLQSARSACLRFCLLRPAMKAGNTGKAGRKVMYTTQLTRTTSAGHTSHPRVLSRGASPWTIRGSTPRRETAKPTPG